MAQPLITSAPSEAKIGQAKDLLTPVLRRYTDQQIQEINEAGGVLQERFGALIDTLLTELITVPAVGEWFGLEVDGDVDPMSVVTTSCFNTKGWQFLGPAFPGKRTYRAKLVELGYVRNLEAARRAVKALDPKYRLLEGQAREPFKAAFPRHVGRPIVFGGNEWQRPHSDRRVAYLGRLILIGESWLSSFYCSDHDFLGVCLWAVVEQDV